MWHFFRQIGIGVLLAYTLAGGARGEAPRVLAAGQLPHDQRLGPLITLNGYFPFTPSATREAWQQRAAELRRQVMVAAGVWPMPVKTPSHPMIHGQVDRGEYTVEKVYFESYPGFYVTGNLYRPKGRTGKLPAVLSPHGHWPNGRFFDAGLKEVRKQIVEGAERFEVGGRYPLQARCVQLARMGCVVFHYDMVGYADSKQLPHGDGSRKGINKAGKWGFFSPQAEARLQTIFGLQGYDSLCAVGLLVRPARGGCDAHRRYRGQRRRNADVHPVRDRSAAGGRFSGSHGFHGDAGRMHVRKRLVSADRDGQRRIGRPVRSQAVGHDGCR